MNLNFDNMAPRGVAGVGSALNPAWPRIESTAPLRFLNEHSLFAGIGATDHSARIQSHRSQEFEAALWLVPEHSQRSTPGPSSIPRGCAPPRPRSKRTLQPGRYTGIAQARGRYLPGVHQGSDRLHRPLRDSYERMGNL